MNNQNKICQNCEREFLIDAQDFDFYQKIKVPAPTWCPECRDVRRFVFRNGHSLYKRKCDLCGESVVSRVSPDKSYKMYCQKCWWSDKWDGLQYGRDYDFGKSFFEQFKELLLATPHISVFNTNTVNSEWVNQETDDKNCYLNVGGHFNEDSAYNTFEVKGKNCFDNFGFGNATFAIQMLIWSGAGKRFFLKIVLIAWGLYFVLICAIAKIVSAVAACAASSIIFLISHIVSRTMKNFCGRIP